MASASIETRLVYQFKASFIFISAILTRVFNVCHCILLCFCLITYLSSCSLFKIMVMELWGMQLNQNKRGMRMQRCNQCVFSYWFAQPFKLRKTCWTIIKKTLTWWVSTSRLRGTKLRRWNLKKWYLFSLLHVLFLLLGKTFEKNVWHLIFQKHSKIK